MPVPKSTFSRSSCLSLMSDNTSRDGPGRALRQAWAVGATAEVKPLQRRIPMTLPGEAFVELYLCCGTSVAYATVLVP